MDEVVVSEEELKRWRNCATETFVEDLSRISDRCEGRYTFSDVSVEMRHRIRELFLERLQQEQRSGAVQQVLRFVRVLARDQSNLDELLCAELVQRVLDASFPRSSGEFHWETLVQAEMCLINLLFNSNLAREQFTEVCTQLLHRIARLAGPVQQQPPAQTNQSAAASEELQFLEALDSEQASQIVFYDLRIAFVASAHSKKLQSRWRKSGCEVFLDVLERSLPLPEKLKVDCGESVECKSFVERTNWALKILFNLFCFSSADDIVQWSAEKCMLLCSRVVLLEDVIPSLEQSAVDVIAVIPISTEMLVPKVQQTEEKREAVAEYSGRDMAFPCAVLGALERRLSAESNKDAELLGTYLTVLIHLCSQVKEARRYVRLRVLPPLHAMDVKRRPDEGAELRNRLIRLMTSISNSCNLAAEFIFILCKKSVSRFVKYCGFGHAAGLLANRGILGALNTPKNPSDSEDSETEDYKAVQGQVNPVTGCIEQPGEDPFAGMTEEQKEYEVHRLMNDISKLMDQGVITPGQIGPDGRLRPAKHVLELVKNADDKTSENASDSDVD